MIEKNAWRTANAMLQQYGKDAAAQAALRAKSLLEKGDMDGHSMWHRVAEAIEELLRRTPDADEPMN